MVQPVWYCFLHYCLRGGNKRYRNGSHRHNRSGISLNHVPWGIDPPLKHDSWLHFSMRLWIRLLWMKRHCLVKWIIHIANWIKNISLILFMLKLFFIIPLWIFFLCKIRTNKYNILSNREINSFRIICPWWIVVETIHWCFSISLDLKLGTPLV